MARALNLVLVLLTGGALLLTPGDAAGQSVPGLGSDGEVGAVVSLRPTASEVASHFLPMLGLGMALRLSPSLEMGGEGFLGLRRIDVSPRGSTEQSELALGYGGLVLRYGPGRESGLEGWRAGLLVGAGTARVRSRLADTELDVDNFFVLEPSLEYRRSLRSSLGIVAGAGYRTTLGANPLPGVEPDDIRGPTLHLGLNIVRDP